MTMSYKSNSTVLANWTENHKIQNEEKGPSKTDVSSFPLLPSTRLLNCVLVFLGTMCNACNFSSFNFALVCMINSTATQDAQNYSSSGGQGVMSNCPYISDVAIINKSSASAEPVQHYDGDINWTREQQANILAAFSWSMTFLNIPDGILVHRFGAKKLFMAGQLLAALASYTIPTAAYLGEWYVWVSRFFAGAASGIAWPAILFMTSRWAPEAEVGRMMTISAAGFPMGAVLAYLMSGGFCDLGTQGWVWSIYFNATLNVLFVLLFFFMFTDDPSTNRFISERELAFILHTRSPLARIRSNSHSKSAPSVTKIPWSRILTSGAVFAVMSSSFCLGWSYYLVVTYIPVYMKEVLFFDSGSNGIVSSLPNLAQFFGRLTFGTVSDRVTGRIGRTLSIKLFDCLALVVPGCMFVIIAFLDCRTWLAVVVCFTVGHFFVAANTGGCIRSLYYIAPRFVGVVSAVGGCLGAMPAILVPYVVGSLTPNGLLSEWRIVFYLSAAVECAGVIISVFLITGEEQKWAKATATKTLEAISESSAKNGTGSISWTTAKEPAVEMDFHLNPKFTRLDSIPGNYQC